MSVAEAAGPSVDRALTESAESDSGFFQRHFCDSKIVDKKWTAKCKLCSKNVSAVAGVNSNFLRHLKRHHPLEWANFIEESESKKKAGQTTLIEIFQAPKLTESRMTMLDDAIVHMICVDEEPLTLTRKQGFTHFLKVSEHHSYIHTVFDSSLLFTLCTRQLCLVLMATNYGY